MIPPVNSLVRYNNPVLVATAKSKKPDAKATKEPAAVSQTEDILNSILPPRWDAPLAHMWAARLPARPPARPPARAGAMLSSRGRGSAPARA